MAILKLLQGTALSAALLALPSCGGLPQVPSRVPGASAQCIATSQIAGRRALPPSSLRFEMIGPFDYVSNVGGGCPAIARLGSSATVSIASGGEGGQLCQGDRVRIFDPVEAKATGFNAEPSCVLGAFIPVSR